MHLIYVAAYSVLSLSFKKMMTKVGLPFRGNPPLWSFRMDLVLSFLIIHIVIFQSLLEYEAKVASLQRCDTKVLSNTVSLRTFMNITEQKNQNLRPSQRVILLLHQKLGHAGLTIVSRATRYLSVIYHSNYHKFHHVMCTYLQHVNLVNKTVTIQNGILWVALSLCS
jgi:hypothetical protein